MASMSYLSTIERFHEYRIAIRELLASILTGVASTSLLNDKEAQVQAMDVLALIESKKFQPEKITTLLAGWDDAPDAFLERTTKVVVHRPSVF